MKDPDFQQLAMKGVEKGYRLTKRSLACVPLTINSIPDVTGPRGGPKIPVDVDYAGFPQFPLTLSIENISCSSRYCTGGAVTYSEEMPSPLQFTFSCNGSSSNNSTSTWSSTLTDADGVKTEPVEHQLTCTPSSSTVAKRGTFSESVTVGTVK